MECSADDLLIWSSYFEGRFYWQIRSRQVRAAPHSISNPLYEFCARWLRVPSFIIPSTRIEYWPVGQIKVPWTLSFAPRIQVSMENMIMCLWTLREELLVHWQRCCFWDNKCVKLNIFFKCQVMRNEIWNKRGKLAPQSPPSPSCVKVICMRLYFHIFI